MHEGQNNNHRAENQKEPIISDFAPSQAEGTDRDRYRQQGT